MADSVERAEQIVEQATQSKRKVVVGYILRHHPSWMRFTELARTLGKPLVMRMNLKQSASGAMWETHKQLMSSVSPIVEMKQTAESSLTAVMGRMAAYTGQNVTWDFMTDKSTLDLFPKNLDWNGELPAASHAIPGKTKLV